MSLTIYHAEGELLYHRAMAEGLPRDGAPTVAVKGYRSHRALGRMWAACRRAHKPRRGPRSTRLTRHRAALVCLREHRIQRRKAWRVTIPVWPPGSEKRRRKFDREWRQIEAENLAIAEICEGKTLPEQLIALRQRGSQRALAHAYWLETFDQFDRDRGAYLPVPCVPPNSPRVELINAKIDNLAANLERVP